jgi:hypothetical protein
MEIEILELEGDAVGCVLERTNIPLRTLQRFMNRLMENLDDDPRSPPGGEP